MRKNDIVNNPADNNDRILQELMEYADKANAEFQAKLTPGIKLEDCLGVRVPKVRALAKKLYKEKAYSDFLKSLPHNYFDENMLHAAIISEIMDCQECILEMGRFAPYIDNWAVCDTIIPKCFKKKNKFPVETIREWAASEHVYICRLGIGCLMRFYLDEDFDSELLKIPADIISDEYYVNMMTAWFFATALAKKWEAVIPYIEKKSLPVWVHNKSIQKALESYRISEQQKTYLRSLKIK